MSEIIVCEDGIPRGQRLITTYNHEPYIAQALDSALAQKPGFPIEILVGEDASTDDTAAIVREYSRRYPDRITAFITEKNEGGHANLSRLLSAARGRFIALLEGDDYWTDDRKLRKQVDFLEAHPEFSLCFHRMKIISEDGVECQQALSNEGDPEVSGLARITKFNYIWTGSVVFRNGLIEGLPPWVHDLPLGDWPLHVLLAEHGQLGLLGTSGESPIPSGGVWASGPIQFRLVQTVRVAEACRQHLRHPGFDDCIWKTSRRIARAGAGKPQFQARDPVCVEIVCRAAAIAGGIPEDGANLGLVRINPIVSRW